MQDVHLYYNLYIYTNLMEIFSSKFPLNFHKTTLGNVTRDHAPYVALELVTVLVVRHVQYICIYIYIYIYNND